MNVEALSSLVSMLALIVFCTWALLVVLPGAIRDIGALLGASALAVCWALPYLPARWIAPGATQEAAQLWSLLGSGGYGVGVGTLVLICCWWACIWVLYDLNAWNWDLYGEGWFSAARPWCWWACVLTLGVGGTIWWNVHGAVWAHLYAQWHVLVATVGVLVGLLWGGLLLVLLVLRLLGMLVAHPIRRWRQRPARRLRRALARRTRLLRLWEAEVARLETTQDVEVLRRAHAVRAMLAEMDRLVHAGTAPRGERQSGGDHGR